MNHEAKITIGFSPIEQRYVASCYPLPDRPGFDACMDWRTKFAEYASHHLVMATELISNLTEPFPHLARLAGQGLFDKISIQSYFEGLAFPETAGGVTYHNPNLYLFVKGAERKKLAQNIWGSVFEHVAGCSVKPAVLSESLVIGYRGSQHQPIDTTFLQGDSHPTDLVLVHGLTQSGAHQAIRYIQPDEFDRFKNWFGERRLGP